MRSFAWLRISLRKGTVIPLSEPSISTRREDFSAKRINVYPPHDSRTGNFVRTTRWICSASPSLSKNTSLSPSPIFASSTFSSDEGFRVSSLSRKQMQSFFHFPLPLRREVPRTFLSRFPFEGLYPKRRLCSSITAPRFWVAAADRWETLEELCDPQTDELPDPPAVGIWLAWLARDNTVSTACAE